ncbi:MAG: 50S ribosome-binding GTPase, partial [Kiritimatiellae bacterium]|nr:50S ribosome-binding GTPase [Kiritimatiellia bacterium]
MDGDTIAAISTAVGPGGISVVRVSGPDAFAIAEMVAGIRPPDCASFPFARFAHFRNPVEGVAADNGILIFFKAPRSYTGEDVVEFQGHGGRMPSSLVLAAVLAAGARQADPGEFTRRAFLNGKIDLARAEAVMDFIGAASLRAAAAAREQLEGALSAKVGAIYEAIVSVEADVEHLLDFEEGEIGDSFLLDALARCRAALSETEALLATWRTGTMLREGALVVICGKPNAGKSSLLNALLGRDRAIVSPVAGTTRDAIEEPFQVEGVPVRLVD